MRLRKLYLLTLVALALLLSAESPKPEPTPTKAPNRQVESHGNDIEQKQGTPTSEPSAFNSFQTAQSNQKSQNENGGKDDGIERQLIEIEKGLVAVDTGSTKIGWLLVGVGILQAMVACFQYRVGKNAAAANSATAAQLALNAERPFVYAESPTFSQKAQELKIPDLPLSELKVLGFDNLIGKVTFEVIYQLRNRGNGIAFIDEVRARFHLATTGYMSPTSEERKQQAKTLVLSVHDRVIGPRDDSTNFIFGPVLDPATWYKIRVGQLRLYLVGFVRYHDAFEQRVRQDFCFQYLVGAFDAQTGAVMSDWFFAGADKNNRTHQEKKTPKVEPTQASLWRVIAFFR